MKEIYVLLWTLACLVLLTAGDSQAADLTGPKVVYDPGQKKIMFFDEKGKMQKEISLESEKTNIKLQDKRLKREWDGEQIIVKQPVIAKNGKFFVIVNYTMQGFLPDGEFIKEYSQGIPYMAMGGTITLYDSFGNILFEKILLKGRGVTGGPDPDLIVTDSGTVVVITGSSGNPEGEDALQVYNYNGVEILTYPQKVGDNVYPNRIMKLSPSGRYLAVRVGFKDEFSTPVFFDLENTTSWKADKNYIVREITDDGIAKASYRNQSAKKNVKLEINLKDLLGGE